MTITTIDSKISKARVRDIMVSNIVQLQIGTSPSNAIKTMSDANVGSAVVMKKTYSIDQPIYVADVAGILPILFAVKQFIKYSDNFSIDSEIIKDDVFVDENSLLIDIISQPVTNQTWRLIVTSGNTRVVGFISVTDIYIYISGVCRK